MTLLRLRRHVKLNTSRFASVLLTATAFSMMPVGARSEPTAARLSGLAAADVWTLDRALTRALEANPDIVAAKHDLERQEGARIQYVARLLPSLSVSASVNERSEGLVDTDLPASQAKPDVALYGYDSRIEVRQLVFDGLSSWNQARRQSLLTKQAYLTLQATVGRVVSTVRQEFDAVLLRRSVVRAEERRVDEFVQLVDWTSRKHAVGDVADFELLRAEAELEGARADLAEANRALSQAEQAFRRILQITDANRPIRLEGAFEPRRFDLPLEQAIAQAQANRPDLQAAALAVKAARRNELSERGNYLPRLEVFASYGARSSYYDSGTRLDGWSYGAMGQWNLFEGGAARGRRISLRAERRGAEAKLSETEQGIVSRLHELYDGLDQAKIAMEAQRKSVEMSGRASHDARRLYEEGQASLEQVLQAGMTFRRAETRLGEAVFNYNSTVSEIEFAIGNGTDGAERVPGVKKP